MKIKSINDCLKFLCNIVGFVDLIRKLRLSLNTLKYREINVPRFLNSTIFSYPALDLSRFESILFFYYDISNTPRHPV